MLGECHPRLGVRPPRAARRLATPERRRGRGPGLAVARQAVRAELRTAGDERRKVGHCLDGPGFRDPDQAVRVKVVTEQQRRVFVGRREQAWRAVVQQVTLVDRLQTERVPLVGERREDRLRLALPLVTQRLLPEGALACRLPGDRPPEIGRYSQPASSFVQ
jgi:hypothetical protein